MVFIENVSGTLCFATEYDISWKIDIWSSNYSQNNNNKDRSGVEQILSSKLIIWLKQWT